jgi:hypothetical protein
LKKSGRITKVMRMDGNVEGLAKRVDMQQQRIQF